MTNQELSKELIAHGFNPTHLEQRSEYRYRGESDRGIFHINVHIKNCGSLYVAMWLNNIADLDLNLNINVSFDWIKAQAKELLGIELKKVKPAITWENAWNGKQTTYLVYSDSSCNSVNTRDWRVEKEKGHYIKRTHAELVQMYPDLLARVSFANKLYPAEEGQTFKYIIPLIKNNDMWSEQVFSGKPSGIYFISIKSFRAFLKEEKNKADLLAVLKLEL